MALQLLLAGACGLAFGSFAVTAGVRIARGERFLTGRSHCDACQIPLGFARTAPVVSFVVQGGSCTACGARIDPTHLAGELAGAAVFLMVLGLPPLRAGLAAALGLCLILECSVDAKVQRLPNLVTAAVAVLAAVLAGSRSWAALGAGLMASAVTVAVLLLVRRMVRRGGEGAPGLGLGDVKLMAALALWLGTLTPWMVLGAAAAGLVAAAVSRDWRQRMAFGPWIALAGWVAGVGKEHGLWPTFP